MPELAGYYEGARVEVEWRDGHQVVIVHLDGKKHGIHDGRPMGLVEAIAGLTFHGISDGRGARVEFVHDDDVDRRIVDLIDLLARIRELHPRMIQLPLRLSEEERARVEEALVR